MLGHRPAAFVSVNRTGVFAAARGHSAADRHDVIRPGLRLRYDLVAIDGMNRRVAIAMKHNGRNSGPGFFAQSRS